MSGGLLDDYWTEREFADQVDRDLRTIRRWKRLRIGPPVTPVGKSDYYKCDSARRWLAALEQQPIRPAKKRRRRGGASAP
jgi:hypothetical protein